MTLALSFLLALLVAAVLVPIWRAIAFRLGYVASPSEGRPLARRKARFGGVALALTLFACVPAVGAVGTAPVLLTCSAFLFLIGFVSDLFSLKPATKLIAVVAVASIFLYFDYRLHWTASLTLDSIVTLFWIVGITSAFSLLDNMDGLCGGIAVITASAFLLTLLPVPSDGELAAQAQYLAVLIGAMAGFLFYNVYPASVALGASGSLVIGLNMAAMTLQIAPGRGSDLLSIIAVPVLLLLIPIIDATLVAMSRVTLPPRPASRDQAYSSYRLVAMGLSERSAVRLLWLLAGASGVVGVAADRQEQVSGLLAAMFIIAMALLAVVLTRVHVHQAVDPNHLPARITPLGIDLGYRRRIVEVMLDLLLVTVAYYGAYRLLFDAVQWAENFAYFLRSFPVVLGTQMIALFFVGAYRGMWRYFSLSDGVTFVKGVFLGGVTSQVGLLYLYRFDGYGPALFIVYGMLLLVLLVGSRASFRLVSEFIQQQRQTGRRLLIYGTGDKAAIAVRQVVGDLRTAYRILGLIHDDVGMRHVRLQGYEVIGGYDHMVGMIMAGEVDAVAVTDEGLATETLALVCARHGVSLLRLTIDWREISAAGGASAAAAVGIRQLEHRVVAFPEVRRTAEAPGALPFHQVAAQTRQASERATEAPAGEKTEPIRVVHIITRLILGGAQENTVATVIGQHRDPRFDVTLVCGVDEAGEGNMFTEVSQAGVRTIVVPSLVREVRPLADVKAFIDLYRLLSRGKFTVVHTHSSKAGIIGRLAARAAGVPVVLHTIHGMAFHEFQAAWKNRLYIILERICAPLSDSIISVSRRLSETALAHHIGRPDQHVTIFSGMELDLFLSVRDQLSVEEAKGRVGIPPDVPVVGKVARLFPLKGHEQFLEVASEVSRQFPETRFLLVGDGPLREALRHQADRRGLGERLIMVGRVPPQDVPAYIQAMDVVVHTSLREGIARVLPQAGAVGKAVVTFALDGAPEVIRDGVSGYLVPPLDTRRMADLTVDLLRDPQRREAFGQAGRTFAAERFAAERMVERINAVYLDLLTSRT